MRVHILFISSLVVILLSGCAGLEIQSIPDAKADETATGFRYYETSPFLLIYSDTKGGIKSQLLYLPDTTKKRSIRPYNYLATNDATLNFDNGRLVQAATTVNESAIPTAIISTLEKLAAAAIQAAPKESGGPEQEDTKHTIPGPFLFRIVKSKNEWKLVGGQALKHGTNKGYARIKYEAILEMPDSPSDKDDQSNKGNPK